MTHSLNRGAAACAGLALVLAVLAGCATTATTAAPAKPAPQAAVPVAQAPVTEPITGTRLKGRSTDRNVKQIGAADARAQMTRDQPAIPMDGGR